MVLSCIVMAKLSHLGRRSLRWNLGFCSRLGATFLGFEDWHVLCGMLEELQMLAALRVCTNKMKYVSAFNELHILHLIVFGALGELQKLQFTIYAFSRR